MNLLDAVKVVYKAMDDKKAENIKVINISEISVMADYFIICSGSSNSQISAITDNVTEELAKIGIPPRKIEGKRNTGWILLDYKDIVIHIFSREDRDFYNLERIWKDGRFLAEEELK